MGVRVRLLRPDGVSLDELERIYRTQGAAFERVAIALIGNEASGCDAVHDAFVRAVRSRKSFRGTGPAVAWVWRIVINEAHRRRDAWRDDPIDFAELELDVPSGNGAGADRALVRTRIAELPERQRLVLFLRYYADLSYEAIAEALEIRPGTVAATLNAAHRRLAHELQEVREWET
jgi:RNA polymerase sigma-70 factor (ECF subfamily)